MPAHKHLATFGQTYGIYCHSAIKKDQYIDFFPIMLHEVFKTAG